MTWYDYGTTIATACCQEKTEHWQIWADSSPIHLVPIVVGGGGLGALIVGLIGSRLARRARGPNSLPDHRNIYRSALLAKLAVGQSTSREAS